MNKMKSRKFLIVLWSCFVISGWGTYSLVFNKVPAWMSGGMALLIAIPAGYVAIGAAKKKPESKNDGS